MSLCSAQDHANLWKNPHNQNMKQKLLTIGLVLAAAFAFIATTDSSFPWRSTGPEAGEGIPGGLESSSEFQGRKPSFHWEGPDPSGNQLILQATRQLSQRGPLISKARFKAELFGVEINGPGQMMFMGNGSAKSRMEFVFSVNEKQHRLIQICDDEQFYFIRLIEGQTHIERIDLEQLQGDRNLQGVHLLSGSLIALLERLESLFEFEQPRESMLGEIPVYQVRGRWKTQAIIRLLEGSVDPDFFNQKDWLQKLPDQIPSQVELTLARDDQFNLFPYRIQFQRLSQDLKKTSHSRTVVSLELFDTQNVNEIPDEMFQIYPGATRPRDRTAYYQKRLGRLNLRR